MGVSKVLQRERERAYKNITPNCRVQCTGCGSAMFDGICKITLEEKSMNIRFHLNVVRNLSL